MRLIDADILLEAIRKHLGIKNLAYLLPAEMSIVQKIWDAPTVDAEVNPWIPCDMSTPIAKENKYWICTDTGYQCPCRWTNDLYGFGESDRWGWKPLDIPQFTKVVAWKNLPEPWKGTNDE